MLVYDRNVFSSNRKIDENGFLRVNACNITRTQVAPYKGSEIPDWRGFGLDENKIYYVLRPEEELKKALPTFNNLPLTRKHIAVDVDNVPKEDIIGSMGDSAEFSDGFLKNSLIIYDQKYIDRVNNGKQKELSCGYRYTPIRQSGEFEGQHYDFIMTNIVGNHVALVKEGRAGHQVMVSDSNESVKEMEMITEDEFIESEHPRAKNGQFTSKGGEGSGSKEESSKETVESVYSKALAENPDDDILRARYNDIKRIKENYEKETRAEEKEEKKADLDFAEKEFLRIYGGGNSESDFEDAIKNAQKMESIMKKHNMIANDKAIPDEQEKPETAGELKAEAEDSKMEEEKKELSETEEAKADVSEEKKEDKAEESKEEDKEKKKKKAESEEVVEDKCGGKMAKDEMTFDIDAIKAEVREELMQDFRSREDARKSVRSIIGDINVMAFDSCSDIYKMACEKAGINVNEVANYKDAFTGFMVGNKANKSKLAMDATPKSSGNEECFKNIRI